MSSFRKGQTVSVRGQSGVVEGIDLTPGMIDVRYGRLVKRHKASEVFPVARNNSGELSGKELLALQIKRLTSELQTLHGELGEAREQERSLQKALAGEKDKSKAGKIRHELGEAGGRVRRIEKEYAQVQSALTYWSKGGAEREQEAYDSWLLSEEGRRTRAFQKHLKDKPMRAAPAPKGQVQTGYAAKLAAGTDQLIREKGAFFVLPDPPRFDFDPTTGNYVDELCGNTIDGSMYAVALHAKGAQKRTHLTGAQWATLVRQHNAAYKDRPLPETLSQVVQFVRPFFAARGYNNVAIRGRKQWASIQEGQGGEVQGLTREEVEKITSGEIQDGGITETISRLDTQIAALQDALGTLPKGSTEYRRAMVKLGVLTQELQAAEARAKASIGLFTPTPQVTRIRRPGKDRTRPAAELLAGTKGTKEKQLYESPFPADAAYWEQANGTFVVIYGMAQESAGRSHLLARFQPPWHNQSGKRFSPFFSWVRLNRPLAAGEERGWYTAPLCVTKRHSEVAGLAREMLRPIREMRSSLMRAGHAASTYAGNETRNTAAARRVGEAALRSLAWAASYLQDAQQTLRAMPARLRKDSETNQLLRSILKTQENPWGVDVAEVLAVATHGPIKLIIPEPRRRSRILDREDVLRRIEELQERGNLSPVEEAQLQEDIKALGREMPLRFQGVPISSGSAGAASLRRHIEDIESSLASSRLSAGVKKQKAEEVEQMESRLRTAVADQIDDAMLRRAKARIKAEAKESGLAALRSALPGPQDLAELTADAYYKPRIDQAEGQRKQNLQEERFHAVGKLTQAALPLFGASDAEDEERLSALRASFYIYYALGGADLVRRLTHAEDMLKRVREDAGRLPPADYAAVRKMIRDTEAQLANLKKSAANAQRLPGQLQELKSLFARVIEEIRTAASENRRNLIPGLQSQANRIEAEIDAVQKEMAASAVTETGKEKLQLQRTLEDLRKEERSFFQGQAPRLEDTEYYYTFNPVLFAVTKQNWNKAGSLFPATTTADGHKALTEKAIALIEDIDAAGRYGHSLKLLYESAKQSSGEEERNLPVVTEILNSRIGQDYFMADMAPKVRGIAALPPTARQAEYKRISEEGVRALSSELYTDLELLEQGRGGRVPLFQQYGSGSDSYYQGWLPEMAELGVPPEEVRATSTDFLEDPVRYLSDLRQRSEEAMLRTTRPPESQSARALLSDIPGVGEKTLEALHEIGVDTLDEAKKVPMPLLQEAVGAARARNIKSWVMRWWQQGKDVKPKRELTKEQRKAQLRKAFTKDMALKVGDQQAIPESRAAPLNRLKLPASSPYKRKLAWSEQQVPSDYPEQSSIAALEALRIDAATLQSLVEQRKLLLTKNLKS